jgi:hypothetical protein
MAIVSVTGTVDGVTYDIENADNDTYSSQLVAPNKSEDIAVTAIDDSGNTSTETETLYVYGGWLPPKTDWTADDYINYEDYNRWIGNLMAIYSLSIRLFPEYTISSLGGDKNFTSMIYASEFNRIENTLETINENTMGFDIGGTKTYYDNGNTPDYEELNRIERAMLLLYNTIYYSIEAMAKLPIKLGDMKGVRQ